MKMRIALVGYGQMGREIENAAGDEFEITARIDPVSEAATHKTISADALKNADVAVEFTNPQAAFENIKTIIALGVDLVVGTTGWRDRLDEARRLVEEAGIGMIYAPNFSLGVNLFAKIIRFAGNAMSDFPQYDCYGCEVHHRRKKDGPSGTARDICRILIDELASKEEAQFDRLERPVAETEIHFASVRGGEVPGTHTVVFDSIADSIELKHTARGRAGFAFGALQAAKWIRGRKGLFTMDDMIA